MFVVTGLEAISNALRKDLVVTDRLASTTLILFTEFVVCRYVYIMTLPLLPSLFDVCMIIHKEQISEIIFRSRMSTLQKLWKEYVGFSVWQLHFGWIVSVIYGILLSRMGMY